MRAALEGLAGIVSVRMDLSRDAFEICYAPHGVTEGQIAQTIVALGFGVRMERSETSAALHTALAPARPVPEPIAAALAGARAAGHILLVDFFATWCAPCRTLEERILTQPGVVKALQRFKLLKIDTDLFPEAGRHYNVSALPTLLILDARGVEIDRMTGSIEASELASRLAAVRTHSGGVQLQ